MDSNINFRVTPDITQGGVKALNSLPEEMISFNSTVTLSPNGTKLFLALALPVPWKNF